MPFTKRQSKIIEHLEELDPKISDAFKGGIEVLETDYTEKITQSAHSLREVIYLLTRLDEIKKLGKVKTMSQGKTRKQDLIKHLDPVQGTPENAYVLYDELINDKLKWFAIVAHHSEFPDERKFRKRVHEFEILLEKIFKPHFDVINEINELLKIIKPTKINFDKLKILISRNSSAYNYFFQNGTSEWLSYLLKNNYLKNSPHITEINGERKFAIWSPATYLLKSASEKPHEVSKIILNIKIPKKLDERNPWLLDYFVKAAVEMPSKYSKLIAEKIYKEGWIETSYHHYLDRPISELMKKLADGGLEKPVMLLAQTLLNVKLGEPYVTGGIIDDYKKIQDVKPIIDHFWYGEILKKEIPYVFEKFPKSITMVLVELVTKMIYLENLGRGDKKSKTDTSVGWRPAIEDHEQNWHDDFRSQLLGTLGNFLISIGQKSIPMLKQIMKNLSKIEFPTFRRLELYVYRVFPKVFQKELDLATENNFDNYELHHEYFHLLQNTFDKTSKKSRKKYLALIEKGPDQKHHDFWELQKEQYGDGFVELKIRLWKADKLKPILKHLSKNEKENFGDVIDEKRGFSHPDFHAYSSGVVMSQPVTELNDNLSTEQVFDFIKNYKSKELDFGVHDGTTEKFQDYVQNNSEKYSKWALQCADLDSIFIYRFFSGIEKSIEQKNLVVWEPVLSLCEKIITAIKKNEFSDSKELSILSSIVAVLEDGIGLDSIPFNLRDRVWNLLSDLIIINENDSTSEESYPREDWDACGISINTIDGKAFHAIMKYAIWCENHLNKKRIFVPEVKELLSNYLEQKIISTVSKQAVLGYYLSVLYYYDKKWMKSKLNNLFKNKNENLARAAWDGYLIGRIYGEIFRDLHEHYDIHVKKLNSPPLKDDRLWKYDERIVHHITSAYLFKFKNSEKLFYSMLNNSHEKILSHCAWHIRRILKDQKGKPNKFFDIDAFKKLWKNSKLTSNEELRTWVEYSPFKKKETLDLLYNSLKKSTKSIRFLSFLVEDLEPYAKTHAQLTFKCLDLLIRKRINDPEFHIAREKLKSLLQILLKNQTTQKKTTLLIHHLGELGYNEYNELLKNNKKQGE